MRKLRLTLLIILLCLVAGSVLFYWISPPTKVSVRMQAEDQDGNSDDQAEPQVREITYNHVENGVRKWSLLADGGELDPTTGFIALEKVKLTFYQENGGTMYLEGDVGEYDQVKQLVVITGNVYGRNHKDVTIKTDKLIYYDDRQMVETDLEVTVAGPTFSITSIGMKAYMDPQRVEFTKLLNSSFWPKEESESKIEDRGLALNKN